MELSAAVERKHGPGCACRKCEGFGPGNQLARKHGGYSMRGISGRAAVIADQIRPTLPAYAECDEPVLQLLSGTLARIESGMGAFGELDRTMAERPLAPYLIEDAARLQRLHQDLRGWIGLARRLANDLGLTPTARAKLALHVVQGEAVRDELLRRYAGDEDAA
jgi:hypothetical protein